MNRQDKANYITEMLNSSIWETKSIVDEALEFYKSYLLLPKRNINDLQVGDYVEFIFYNEDEEHEEVKGVITENYPEYKSFCILNREIEHEYITDIDLIIPYEGIDLLKEMVK